MTKPPRDIDLPSEDELNQLPPEAIVAYAARCAMRVQPLLGADSFGDLDKEIVRKHIEAIDIAITISAVSPHPVVVAVAANLSTAVSAANAAGVAVTTANARSAANAANAAASAVAAVKSGLGTDIDVNTVNAIAVHAYSAATHADFAYTRAPEVANENALATRGASRADYEFLKHSKEDNEKNHIAIFAEPLWQRDGNNGEVSQKWNKMLDRWEQGLNDLGLDDIALRHHRLIDGGGINWGKAQQRITAWLASHASSGSVSTRKKSQVKKKRAKRAKAKSTKKTIYKSISPAIEDDKAVALEHVKQATSEPDFAMNDSVPTHSDEDAKVDYLGRKVFALALTMRIRHITAMNREVHDASFLLNLHGPWGAGKTSLLNFMSDELGSTEYHSTPPGNDPLTDPWIVVHYNAWKQHRGGPAWWTFMDALYNQIREELVMLDASRSERLMWREIKWRFFTKHGGVAIGAFGFVWVLYLLFRLLPGNWSDQITTGATLSALIVSVGSLALGAAKTLMAGSARAANTFIEVAHDPVEEISKHFRDIVSFVDRPILVMIDDLDRCPCDFVIELLESIQTKFRNSNVAYVVAADRRWLCASYQSHYETYDDAVGELGRPLGYLFLEKIFQLSATVPGLSPAVKEQYWRRLVQAKAAPRDEDEPDFDVAFAEAEAELETIEEEAEILKRIQSLPTATVQGQALRQAAVVRLSVPEVEQRTEHALLPFAHLLDGNPRSMKRLVNAYGIQRAISLLAGIDVPTGELVLWSILSLRWPILAEWLQSNLEWIEYIGNGEKIEEALASGTLPKSIDEYKSLFRDPEVKRVVSGEGISASITIETLKRLMLLQTTDDTLPAVA